MKKPVLEFTTQSPLGRGSVGNFWVSFAVPTGNGVKKLTKPVKTENCISCGANLISLKCRYCGREYQSNF